LPCPSLRPLPPRSPRAAHRPAGARWRVVGEKLLQERWDGVRQVGSGEGSAGASALRRPVAFFSLSSAEASQASHRCADRRGGHGSCPADVAHRELGKVAKARGDLEANAEHRDRLIGAPLVRSARRVKAKRMASALGKAERPRGPPEDAQWGSSRAPSAGLVVLELHHAWVAWFKKERESAGTSRASRAGAIPERPRILLFPVLVGGIRSVVSCTTLDVPAVLRLLGEHRTPVVGEKRPGEPALGKGCKSPWTSTSAFARGTLEVTANALRSSRMPSATGTCQRPPRRGP